MTFVDSRVFVCTTNSGFTVCVCSLFGLANRAEALANAKHLA